MSNFIVIDTFGTGLLCLDYSGPPPSGQSTSRIELNLHLNGGLSFQEEYVYYTDGSSDRFQLDGFNLFDITASAGDDIVEVIHADNIQILDGGSGLDRVGFNASASSVAFDLDIDSTTDQFVSIEQFFGSLSSVNDTARLGFAVSDLSAGNGIDFLELDYSGTSPTGQSVNRVDLNFHLNGGLSFQEESVLYSDGSSSSYQLDSFELYDITTSAGNDIVDFIHEDDVQMIDGRAGLDIVGFHGGASNVAFDLDIDSTTDQFVSIEQFYGTLSNSADTARLGFALNDLDGANGVDFLELNYSGPSPTGQSVDRVYFNFQSNGGLTFERETVYYTDNSTDSFELDNFELYDITTTAGDDIVEFIHEDNIQRIDGGGGIDLVGFNGSSGNDAFDIDIDSTTDQFISIEQFFGDLSNSADSAKLGFALHDLNGANGVDFLELDYSGTSPDGQSVDRVDLNLQSNGGLTFERETVYFTSGSSASFELDNFEVFDVTATSGNDVIEFFNEDSVQRVDGRGGLDLVGFNGGNVAYDIDIDSTTDQYFRIEQFFGTLSNANDTARLGFALNDMDAGNGIDFLELDYSGNSATGQAVDHIELNLDSSGSSFQQRETVSFTDGSSTSFLINSFEEFYITATNGDDEITTIAGDDTVFGGGGNDIIELGDGDDIAFGQGRNDTIRGGGGRDEISGGAGADNLFGDGGADTIDGDSGADTVDGGAGNDTIFGGNAADVLSGGTGNDIIRGEGFTDTLNGGGGADTLIGGGSADTLYGDGGADELFGNNAGDFLDGGGGNDSLNGGASNDELHGGAGDDQILGSTGDDQLYGEAGADTFEFRANHGSDRIFDFEDGIDVIEFDINSVSSINDLTLTNVFAGVDIDYGTGTIRVIGLSDSDFSSVDFIFS